MQQLYLKHMVYLPVMHVLCQHSSPLLYMHFHVPFTSVPTFISSPPCTCSFDISHVAVVCMCTLHVTITSIPSPFFCFLGMQRIFNLQMAMIMMAC
eukprot:m.201583 g.201583  ORF g.201583 m.201583 type:complete len:96 (-) comp16866_c1_seq3:107-394(-)